MMKAVCGLPPTEQLSVYYCQSFPTQPVGFRTCTCAAHSFPTSARFFLTYSEEDVIQLGIQFVSFLELRLIPFILEFFRAEPQRAGILASASAFHRSIRSATICNRGYLIHLRSFLI